MKKPSGLLLVFAATVLALLVFALAPQLDLAVAGFFHRGGQFIGRGAVGEAARFVGYYAPYLILAVMAGAWALRRLGAIRRAPSGRAMIFLLTTLALGPGLVANVLLKDNSHRPRPEQSAQFGGKWAFRPYYAFDGACANNCSFVSGEAATAFWTVAPALLAPPTLRPYAVGAALVFGLAVSALRMAFGGHYLSDVTLGALLTLLIVLAFHRLLFDDAARGKGKRE